MIKVNKEKQNCTWNCLPVHKTTWEIESCCSVELKKAAIGGLETSSLRIINEDGDSLYLNREEAIALSAILTKASRSIL